jgi:hypothetical protein
MAWRMFSERGDEFCRFGDWLFRQPNPDKTSVEAAARLSRLCDYVDKNLQQRLERPVQLFDLHV